jgi:hypothetical protein
MRITRRERDAFLLIYSVTSRATFERLEEFRQRALRGKHPTTPPMIVVGTKCDCTEAEREVFEAEGAEFAANIGILFARRPPKRPTTRNPRLWTSFANFLSGRLLLSRRHQEHGEGQR